MNQQPNHIATKVRKLKLHLEQYPKQALGLAIDYYQNFLVLASETENLQERLQQLKQPNVNPELILHFPYSEARLTLEHEYRVDALERHLRRTEPQKIKLLATIFFGKHLVLAQQYQKLEAQFYELKAKRIQLRKLSLPQFL